MVRGFSPPASTYGAGHRGVDLAGVAGSTVRAALGGRVSFAGALAGKGVVVVDHGQTRTTYEPVLADVAVGARVEAGGALGALAAGPSHCAPATCLHWGWIGRGPPEVYLDPLALVGQGPVRLKPWAGLGGAAPTVRPGSPAPLPAARVAWAGRAWPDWFDAPRVPVQARGWAWR